MKLIKILSLLLIISSLFHINIGLASGWEKNSYSYESTDITDAESFQRIYFGLNGGFSFAMFGNESLTTPVWQPRNVLSITPSIDATYLITKNIGIGLGVKLGNYTSDFKITNLTAQLEREFVDLDEDTYSPIYEDVNLVENTSYTTLDIPVFVRYQNNIGSGNLSYFANLGVMFSNFSNPKFTLSGTMTRKGYYPDYNVVLNNYPEYNFEELSYSTSKSMELGAPKMLISGYLSAGAMYSITSDILVKVGVSGTYGFTKVEPVIEDSFSDFHSSLILGSSSISSIGFDIGVVYKLFNK